MSVSKDTVKNQIVVNILSVLNSYHYIFLHYCHIHLDYSQNCLVRQPMGFVFIPNALESLARKTQVNRLLQILHCPFLDRFHLPPFQHHSKPPESMSMIQCPLLSPLGSIVIITGNCHTKCLKSTCLLTE